MGQGAVTAAKEYQLLVLDGVEGAECGGLSVSLLSSLLPDGCV